MALTYPLFTFEESELVDRFAIQTWGVPSAVWMGMAAQGVFHQCKALWDDAEEIHIFCGKGGNGGDGYCLAHLLQSLDYPTIVWEVEEPKREDTALFRSLLEVEPQDARQFSGTSGKAILVEALFGIGIKEELDEPYKSLVQILNEQEQPILSLDTPSPGLQPTFVIEIGTQKWENLGWETKVFCPIGFPSQAAKPSHFGLLPYSKEKLEEKLQRPYNAHKYTLGACVFFGGEAGYPGSIALAEGAFRRTGGGIAKCYVGAPSSRDLLLQKDPSCLVGLWEDFRNDSFLAKSKLAVVGPGTNFGPLSLPELPQYCILDAGAIHPENLIHLKGKNVLLTPHTGELQKLLGKWNSLGEERNLALQFCRQTGFHLLHKCHASRLYTPTGEVFVWDRPNPRLATMGTGDLLCGFLARFYLGTGDWMESLALSYSLFESLIDKGYPTAYDYLEALKEF